MLLEYFQMIDHVEAMDLEAATLRARSTVPRTSSVFEGHFPGMPLVPGVLLIETMAQAAGFLVLARSDFAVMPFLMSVDNAKLRDFVAPETELSIEAGIIHEGSGYTVAKTQITSGGKRVCNAQLKLRLMPADNRALCDLVRERADGIGLARALDAGSPSGAPA